MMNSDSGVLFPCPRCGMEDQLRIGQAVFRGKLRWYESTNCNQCGMRAEADGVGLPPMSIRDRLLLVDGHWKLVLLDVKSISAAAKVLREHLSFGAKEALCVLQSTGEEVVYSGTKAEALWLAGLLEKVGEAPQVLRVV